MLEKDLFIVKILNFILIGFAIFFFTGFFSEHSPLSNNSTIVLDLVLTFILFSFNNTKKTCRSNMSFAVTFLYCMFVFPRLICYIYIPNFITLPFSEAKNVNIINKGLLLFTLSTLMLYSGFYVAKFFKKNEPLNIKFFSFQPLSIFFSGLMILTIDLYLNFSLSNFYLFSNTDTKSQLNPLVQLIKAFISFDTFFYTLLAITFIRKSAAKNRNIFSSHLRLTLLFFLLYECYCVIFGSRGGFVRVFMQLLSIFIFLKDNFIYKKITTILIVVALFTLSIATFPLGTAIRDKIVSASSINLSNYVLYSNSDNLNVFSRHQNYKNTSLILDRIGIIDYAILIPFAPYDSVKMEHFINFTYIAKSLANTFLPGNIFHEAPLVTSRAINPIFRGYPIEYPESHGYFSEYWTSFALLFLLFGFLAIPLHFVLGFLMEYIYLLVANSAISYKQYYSVLYLFLIPFLVVFTMGFEHTLLTVAVVTFQFSFAILSINFLTTQFTNIRKYLKGLK